MNTLDQPVTWGAALAMIGIMGITILMVFIISNCKKKK